MNSYGRVFVILLTLSGFVEICLCSDREFPSRKASRRSNFGQQTIPPQMVAQDQQMLAKLNAAALGIEEKLAKIEKFNEEVVNKILLRLEGLDGKIDEINDKLFNEKTTAGEPATLSVRLIVWEEKISELDRKISKFINQSDKHFGNDDDTTTERFDQPLHLKICDDSLIDIEVVTQQLNQSFKSFSEKIAENLSENGEKIEYLSSYLQTLFDGHANTSDSRPDNISLEIQRKERRTGDQTSLINGILSMVRERLNQEEVYEKKRAELSGSMADMFSSFENKKPTTALNQKNKTTLSSRKGGLIYPNAINKPAKVNMSFTSESFGVKHIKGFSCVELMNAGMRQSGVYYLQIRGTTYWFLKVFCEQEIADGGWTVIQRRDEFGEPRENFNRDWADYKNGFGDPAKEFWMGNENIYMLTNNEDYALRIELEDFEGNKRYAQYSRFKLHSEADYYKLEIDGFEGTAGDSLNDLTYGSNNSPFSTYNRDNDRSSLNCASMLKGGWWWKSCGRGLNGLYLHDPKDIAAKLGIIWFKWKGWDYTLKKSTMMVKPLTKSMTS